MSIDRTNSLRHGNILIVEDNPPDLKFMSEILTKAGYRVRAASDGELALRSVQAELPDLILLDMNLPGLNGIEVCHRLKTGPETKDIPVIFISALGETDLKVKALETGGTDYVTKPIDSSEVLARINTHLNMYQLQRRLAIQSEELLAEIDERKRVQEELQRHREQLEELVEERTAKLLEREERYTDLFESSLDGIAESTLEGKLLDCNSSYALMTGYSKEELKKLSYQDLTPLKWAEVDKKHVQQCFDRGFSDLYEKERIRKDGTIFPISIRIWLRKDHQGKPLSLWGIVQDISERKRAEQWKALNIGILNTINNSEKWKDCIEEILVKIQQSAGYEAVAIRLRENEDFPYYVTKGFPGDFVEAEKYLCTRDSKGEITRDSKGNPYVECMCGNVICGRTDPSKDFFTDNGSFWSNNTSKLLSETTDEDRQARTRNRCNSEGYESVALFPLKVGQEILGLLQINDTRPHQFTDDIIQYFEDIGISVGTAFSRKRAEDALKESEEKYRSIMKSMKDYVYITSEEFRIEYMNPGMISKIGYDATGEICHKAIYDNDEKCSWCIFDQTLQKKCAEYELKNPRDNHFYTVMNSPISHVDGSISKLTIHHDITANKTIESQLRQAHKMESVGTLAGGIAHDFNNILYMILGNTELALEDIPEWNPVHESLEEVKAATLRASGIVKHLLNFSRNVEQKLVPMDIITTINSSLKFLRSSIPYTIEIRKNIPITSITIDGDPNQIHQVLMNIFSNASQEMEAGGLLELAVQKTDIEKDGAVNNHDIAPGKYVKITVSDTGSGIDPEIKDKIFDPYFTTKEVGKGSGMGLAIVHGIVKSHKGFILVDSKPEKGTTFDIFFPITNKMIEVETQTTDELPLGNEKILFVDDEKSIVKMTGKTLQRLGYQVEIKTNPLEAIELFQSKSDQFDLVITDMTMPQMTGVKLKERLKEIRSDIPVIICTGHSSLIDDEKAKEMGIDAYVMKPIVKQEIAKTIRKVLDSWKS